MIDPRNLVSLTAGVVADPELINDRIAKVRIAVDYAGSEKGSSASSGYFDLVYYLKEGEDHASKNAKFIHDQITQKKLRKGSQVQIVGRLVQERWQQDNSNRSRVVIVAESISYVGTASPKSGEKEGSSSSSSESAHVPSSF
jgi:hypothetical protein